MPVINPETGQKEAEIEGGERIFSVEDTQQMEHMAQAIASAGDEEQQFQAAAQLGLFVTEALMKQEKAASQQAPPEAQPQQAPEQPAFGKGGKLSFSYTGGENRGGDSLSRLMGYIT